MLNEMTEEKYSDRKEMTTVVIISESEASSSNYFTPDSDGPIPSLSCLGKRKSSPEFTDLRPKSGPTPIGMSNEAGIRLRHESYDKNVDIATKRYITKLERELREEEEQETEEREQRDRERQDSKMSAELRRVELDQDSTMSAELRRVKLEQDSTMSAELRRVELERDSTMSAELRRVELEQDSTMSAELRRVELERDSTMSAELRRVELERDSTMSAELRRVELERDSTMSAELRRVELEQDSKLSAEFRRVELERDREILSKAHVEAANVSQLNKESVSDLTQPLVIEPKLVTKTSLFDDLLDKDTSSDNEFKAEAPVSECQSSQHKGYSPALTTPSPIPETYITVARSSVKLFNSDLDSLNDDDTNDETPSPLPEESRFNIKQLIRR